MNGRHIYCAGTTPAIQYAKEHLAEAGYTISSQPQWDTSHLLLDVPSFRPGSPRLDTLLSAMNSHITVWGGNLGDRIPQEIHQVDLLRDETYLAKNAAITARCALRIAGEKLPCTLHGLPVLVIGWGRIGKCLAKLLKDLDADVTVAARSHAARAALSSMDCKAIDCTGLESVVPDMRLIFNTVPEMILPQKITCLSPSSIKIDLASQKGMEGDDVLWARGLPGIHAPESSGRLIAETFLRLVKEDQK